MLDFRTVKLTGKPNQYLMIPEGFECAAKPHARSPSFEQSPEAVREAVLYAIQRSPRITILENGEQIKLVQRSKLMRFPDTIHIQVMTTPDGKTSLGILSSSKYGYSDWGVNKSRIDAWIREITNALDS